MHRDGSVLDINFDPTTGILRLRGELDANSAAALLSETRGFVGIHRIDGRGLRFVAAAGLTALLEISRQRPITVLASGPLRRLVQICGLGETLRLES